MKSFSTSKPKINEKRRTGNMSNGQEHQTKVTSEKISRERKSAAQTKPPMLAGKIKGRKEFCNRRNNSSGM